MTDWLERIARALEASNPWLDVFGTLIATLVGAGVALLGAWFIFRRESRERYDERLNEALASVLLAGAALITELEDWKRNPIQSVSAIRTVPRPGPSAESFTTVVAAASLAARGADLAIVQELRRASRYAHGQTADGSIGAVDDIIEVITRWRTGESRTGEALTMAKKIPMPRDVPKSPGDD